MSDSNRAVTSEASKRSTVVPSARQHTPVGLLDDAPGRRAGGDALALLDERDVQTGGLGTHPPSVTCVIPTLNEAANLPHVLAEIPSWIDEIIIVDGGSVDGTTDVARRIRPDALVLTQTGTGKGNALSEGFEAASCDIIVMLDADGSTDPREIPRYVAALRTGADFAKGTRFVVGGGSADITNLRHWGNSALAWLVNTMWGTRYSDLCYGYNAFWRHRLDALRIDSPGFEVETLLNIRAAKAKLKVVEVPSFERHRMHGVSNLRARQDGMRVLRTIIAEWIRPR